MLAIFLLAWMLALKQEKLSAIRHNPVVWVATALLLLYMAGCTYSIGSLDDKLDSLNKAARLMFIPLFIIVHMIDEYNAGSRNAEQFFNELIEFSQRLTAEEQRHIAENLTEEELALFDLLTRQPDVKLTRKVRKQVKQAARALLAVLKAVKLTLDWRKRQQSRAAVRVAIGQVLDERLPEIYTGEFFDQKCEMVYQHIYESYFGEGRSIYSMPLAM